MSDNVLDSANHLAELGFNPLPTRRGKKSPGLPSWQEYQRKRADDKIKAWWGPGSTYTGIWVVCGSISGLVVLDCDIPEAEIAWRSILGETLDQTTCVRTSKGRHYWFRLPNSDGAGNPPPPGARVEHGQGAVKSWSWEDADKRHWFDVKAEGGGVMAPPSEHPDGGYYEWIRGPEYIVDAPDAVLDGGTTWAAYVETAAQEIQDGGHGRLVGGAAETSRLSALLATGVEVGSRNNWLTQVAGHYAKIIPYEDAYRETVIMANNSLAEPLDQGEVDKVTSSVWKAERHKGMVSPEQLREQGLVVGEPAEDNGWLIGTGDHILCPVLVKGDNDKLHETLTNWADFDIKVQGVLKGEERTDYLVELRTQFGAVTCQLSGSVLGRSLELQKWLAERRCSIITPQGALHGKVPEAKRFQRYVQAQSRSAPQYKTVESLGWHDIAGGFITHEGIIRAGATKVDPYGDIRPDPKLLNWAPYTYGFAGSRGAARDVLKEVLSFHDEMVTAVFGSWWAACFLKAHIEKETALFPFMALRAASESGKTTGFFALMMQLSGNKEGHGEYTSAVLRDRVSAHKNGVVWIDDVTNMDETWDTVRQATMGGGRTKKSQDRYTQEYVKLVAPIAISAEGMEPLTTEKALADRAILLSVPSPTGRTSLRPGREGRPQWDDILDLMAQWKHDLTQLAGWYVSMALEQRPLLDELKTLRIGGGRHGDKLATLRVGARVLEAMSGAEQVVELVDRWAAFEAETYIKGDNILTTEILPVLWKSNFFARHPGMDTAVYADAHGTIHYNERLVAEQWASRRSLTFRQRQLGSMDSLVSQRRDLGIEGTGRRIRVGNRKDNLALRFHTLNPEMSQLVINRAQVSITDLDQMELGND